MDDDEREEAMQYASYGRKSAKTKSRRAEEAMLGVFASDDDSSDDAQDDRKGKGKGTGRGLAEAVSTGVSFVSGSVLLPSAAAPVSTSTQSSSSSAPGLGLGAAPNSNNSAGSAGVQSKFKPQKPGVAVGGEWEKYTKGIGSKLLAKMGYTGGGLGANNTGIAAPVEVKLRPKQMGIGYNDFDERTNQSKRDFGDAEASDEDEALPEGATAEMPRSSREGGWKKGTKRPRRVYETQAEAPTNQPQQKILVFGAGGVRALGSVTEALQRGNEAAGAASFLPELRFNITLLVDSREAKLHTVQQRLQNSQANISKFSQEVTRRVQRSEDAKQKVESLTDILAILKEVEQRFITKGMTPEQSLPLLLKLLQFVPPNLAPTIRRPVIVHRVIPAVADLFKDWSPIEKPSLPVDPLKPWRTLIVNESDAMLFARIQHACLMPRLRFTFLDDNWNSRTDIPRAIELVKVWKAELLAPVRVQFIREVVVGRLRREIAKWNPRKDRVPVSDWMLPWRAVLSASDLLPLDDAIRSQLASLLVHWDPMDASAVVILAPWASDMAWGSAAMDVFVRRTILPRLAWHIGQNPPRLPFDPSRAPSEEDPGWKALTSWSAFMKEGTRMTLLLEALLPRWFMSLHGALLGRAISQEAVAQWYIQWKMLITSFANAGSGDDYLDERLGRAFQLALEMMQASMMGGAPQLPSPSLYQNISHKQAQSKMAAKGPTYSQVSQQAPTLRDLVTRIAEEHGIVFQPTKRQQDHKQVYAFGNEQIYLEPQKDLIVAFRQGQWMPTTVERLVDLAKKS